MVHWGKEEEEVKGMEERRIREFCSEMDMHVKVLMGRVKVMGISKEAEKEETWMMMGSKEG